MNSKNLICALSLMACGGFAFAGDEPASPDPVEGRKSTTVDVGEQLPIGMKVFTTDDEEVQMGKIVPIETKTITVIHTMETRTLEAHAMNEQDEWIDEKTQSELTRCLKNMKEAQQRMKILKDQYSDFDEVEINYVVIGFGQATKKEFADKVATYFEEHEIEGVKVYIDRHAQVQQALGLKKSGQADLVFSGRFLRYFEGGKTSPKDAMKPGAKKDAKTPQKELNGEDVNFLARAITRIARGKTVLMPYGKDSELPEPAGTK